MTSSDNDDQRRPVKRKLENSHLQEEPRCKRRRIEVINLSASASDVNKRRPVKRWLENGRLQEEPACKRRRITVINKEGKHQELEHYKQRFRELQEQICEQKRQLAKTMKKVSQNKEKI